MPDRDTLGVESESGPELLEQLTGHAVAMLPGKTRAFIDFVVETFKREGHAKRFAGSLG